ncbi:MAG TPA: hypothetical protein VI653_16885 [Steroidobacteraceae bacterium]
MAFVQGDAGSNAASVSSGSSNGITTTTGNWLGVVISAGNGPKTVTGISDTYGNTWQAAASNPQSPSAAFNIYVYYAENITGGAAHKVTATFSGATPFAISVVELSGRAKSSSILAQAPLLESAATTSHTSAATGALSLGGADVVCLAGDDAAFVFGGDETYAATSSGWTLPASAVVSSASATPTTYALYIAGVGTGSQIATWTNSTHTLTAASVILAVAAASSGGGDAWRAQSGPGISPDKRTMFRPRPVSSFIVQPSSQGVASANGFAVGLLTGATLAPVIGYARTSGPGISPDYARTFYRLPSSTSLQILTPITGVAFAAGHSVGSLLGTANLQGTALGAGYGPGASLGGLGALNGVAAGLGFGLGTLGSGTLTNISGVAFSAGAVVGTITGSGSLLGRASAEGSGRGTLTGAGALTGVASAEGSARAAPSGAAALTGFVSAEGQTSGLLTGQALLHGVAASVSGALGTLTGNGALAGRAFAAGVAYGPVLGVGALAGVAVGQGSLLGTLIGSAQLAGITIGQSYALGLVLPFGAGQMSGVAAGFSFALGSLAGVGHLFGWANVNALSQNGLPVARACYIEQSAARITAAYFDTTGLPFVPNAVAYRIDDVVSGANILGWTDITPELINTVTVTSAQNALISLTRESEAHQVLFRITDGLGNVSYADVEFDLIRVSGLG